MDVSNFPDRYKEPHGGPICSIAEQLRYMNVVVKRELNYGLRNPEGLRGGDW